MRDPPSRPEGSRRGHATWPDPTRGRAGALAALQRETGYSRKWSSACSRDYDASPRGPRRPRPCSRPATSSPPTACRRRRPGAWLGMGQRRAARVQRHLGHRRSRLRPGRHGRLGPRRGRPWRDGSRCGCRWHGSCGCWWRRRVALRRPLRQPAQPRMLRAARQLRAVDRRLHLCREGRHDVVWRHQLRRLGGVRVGRAVLQFRLPAAQLYRLPVRRRQLWARGAHRERRLRPDGGRRDGVQRRLLLQQLVRGPQQQRELRLLRSALRLAVVRAAARPRRPVLLHLRERLLLPGRRLRQPCHLLERRHADALQLPMRERHLLQRPVRGWRHLRPRHRSKLLPLLKTAGCRGDGVSALRAPIASSWRRRPTSGHAATRQARRPRTLVWLRSAAPSQPV
jgi:hypothetical protein